MELSLDKIIEFIVTSGLYLVILGNLFRVIKKGNNNKKKYSTDTIISNVKDKKRDERQVLYTEEPKKGMKKQSVFTSVMQQVDKISSSFESFENTWSKDTKATSENVEQPTSRQVSTPKTKNQKNSNKIIELTKQEMNNSKIYEPINEISDMSECIHEDSSTILKFKKNEIKKAIIMKEILDKPRAYKQARR